MLDQLIFEQPLNERIRTFLRLEHLFNQFSQHIEHHSDWDTYSAVKSILDIMSMLGRGDIKRETIKELERQHTTLKTFTEISGINQDKLKDIINEQEACLQKLHGINSNIGQDLLQNELLNAIRQRLNMPGGLCEFDLPVYAHWLSQPYEKRIETLQKWFQPFTTLENAIRLILKVIRDSTDSIEEIAEGGFYQKTLDSNQACLMIRVTLPKDSNLFPEISAGKHRFTVRFLTACDPSIRPEQNKLDTPFKIACCIL